MPAVVKRERVKQLKDFFLEAIGLKPGELEENSLSQEEFLSLFSGKQPFSKYIMPVAYNEDLGIYINQDGTIGVMFECIPLLFASPQTIKSLSSLFHLNLPKGSTVQFILYADPFIEDYLYFFIEAKQRALYPQYSFLRESYKQLTEHYRNIKKIFGFPARRFRLFITLKFPVSKEMTDNDIKEIKLSVQEILKSSNFSVIDCKPDEFLFFMRQILNGVNLHVRTENGEVDFPEIFRRVELLHLWDKRTRLNRQVIFSDTNIESEGSKIKIKDTYFRALTWKVMPEKIDFLFGNLLTGVYDLQDGIAGDAKQIPCPFLAVFNVFCDSINLEIQTKANLILQQQPLGTFFVTLKEKTNEYLWAVQKINDGEKFLRCFLTFWLFDRDEEELRGAIHKTARLLESLGGAVQEETVISLPLFVYSLPFGGVCDKKNFTLLDRDFVMGTESVAATAPVQADFLGTGDPVLMFLGRKGQVCGLDIFSKKSANYNFFVAAPTGKGKSFFINYLVANYFGAEAKVRIIDIGGSYKKLVNMFGGRYLEFSPESNIVINPFASIVDPEYDVPVVAQVLTLMCSAVSERLPEEISLETAYNMIQLAVREVLRGAEEKGIPYNQVTIDDVYYVLSHFMEYFPDPEVLCTKDHCIEGFEKIASHLAFNLHKFTSSGIYGKWFIGENSFDISKDEFVVLELEHLKVFPDLFKVVTLSILNAVTADLYLSDRTRPTLIVMDEAWQFLQDNPAFEKVVEEGYRRARKYYGSFGIVTQDLLDLEGFGRVGRVIYSNSAFKFVLSGVKAGIAKEKKLVDFDEFTIHLINSLKYNAPKYSEIMVITDNFGSGVIRLTVDPYSYFVYTSRPDEISEIENMVKRGMSYNDAIKEMVRKYKKTEEVAK